MSKRKIKLRKSANYVEFKEYDKNCCTMKTANILMCHSCCLQSAQCAGTKKPPLAGFKFLVKTKEQELKWVYLGTRAKRLDDGLEYDWAKIHDIEIDLLNIAKKLKKRLKEYLGGQMKSIKIESILRVSPVVHPLAKQ